MWILLIIFFLIMVTFAMWSLKIYVPKHMMNNKANVLISHRYISRLSFLIKLKLVCITEHLCCPLSHIYWFQRVIMKLIGGWINSKVFPNCIIQKLVTSDFLTGILRSRFISRVQTEITTRLFAVLRWCSISSTYMVPVAWTDFLAA